ASRVAVQVSGKDALTTALSVTARPEVSRGARAQPTATAARHAKAIYDNALEVFMVAPSCSTRRILARRPEGVKEGVERSRRAGRRGKRRPGTAAGSMRRALQWVGVSIIHVGTLQRFRGS